MQVFLILSSSGQRGQLSSKFGTEQVTKGELVSGVDVAKKKKVCAMSPSRISSRAHTR